ncbi:hypothetical protein FNV43_RR27361 [Rhamnella rubrinervis]|uniref:C2H2-type domain-containing protein n=1 Tax=Rhamnella rubrinervis TaxID=2594499 RepID=A0A8K0DLH4_9ROSA|nr:hypothetical protein FNV43_RR27361 [Rhamnella rubrinervis]
MKLKINNSSSQKLHNDGGLGFSSKINDLGANERSHFLEPTCSLSPIEFPPMKSVFVSDRSGSSCSSKNCSEEELIESRVSNFEPLSKTEKRSSDRRSRSCIINNEVDSKRKFEEEDQQSDTKNNEVIRNMADYDSDDAYWLGLDQDVEKKQWTVEDQNVVNHHGFIGTLRQGGLSNNLHDGYDYYISGSERERISTSSMRNKDSKKKQKRCSFGCSICGRTFPTFQAMGGHKSSHNKHKKSYLSAISAGADSE